MTCRHGVARPMHCEPCALQAMHERAWRALDDPAAERAIDRRMQMRELPVIDERDEVYP